MPGFPSAHRGLEASVCFVVPREELSDPEQYLQFDGARPLPTRETRIPIHDLRVDMESGLAATTEQLDETG